MTMMIRHGSSLTKATCPNTTSNSSTRLTKQNMRRRITNLAVPVCLTALKTSGASKQPVSFCFPTVLHHPNGANVWHRFWAYLGKDPQKAYMTVSLHSLHSFFDWLLNQRRGKGGRRRRRTKVSSSLGTYWKVYRLVYERATGAKLDVRGGVCPRRGVTGLWLTRGLSVLQSIIQ
jgi:hypothetical protein